MNVVMNEKAPIYKRAAGLYIFHRMLMRIQPEDNIGYGGEEGMYFVPRMTLEEKKQQGIVGGDLINIIAGVLFIYLQFLASHVSDFGKLFSIRNTEKLITTSLKQFEAYKADDVIIQLGYLFGNIGLLCDEKLYNAIHDEKILKLIVEAFFYYSYNSIFHRQITTFICKGIELLHDNFIIDLVSDTDFVKKALELHDQNKKRVYPAEGERPQTTIPIMGHLYQIVSTVLIDGAIMTPNGEVIEAPPTKINKTAIFLDANEKWGEKMEELICEMKVRLYRKINSPEERERRRSSMDISVFLLYIFQMLKDPLKGKTGGNEEFGFPDPLDDSDDVSFTSFGNPNEEGFGDEGFGGFGTFGGEGDENAEGFGDFGTFGDENDNAEGFGSFA